MIQLRRRRVIERLHGERGQALTILPTWEQALHALEDPEVHEILWKDVRQSGKSQGATAIGIAETVVVPQAYVVLMSASVNQAEAIFARKVRRQVERLARELGLRVTTTKRGFEFPALGSAFEVLAPNETTAPGRSPTLLIMDEARDIQDETYETTVPSVIGAGGKVLIVSTPGVMRGFYYQLVTHPGPGTVLIESRENRNPYASKGMISFLRDRLRLWNPAAEQRELGGEFAEEGGEFLRWSLIESAVDERWSEWPTSPLEAFGGLDLSRKKDLTSLVVLLRGPARRPEAADHLDTAVLRVWDPATEPDGEVPFEQVRAALLDVIGRFPNIMIAVDEGSEGGSVLPFCRGRAELVNRVTGFTGSVETNMSVWSALAARLHSGTLTLPPNPRLLSELRNLKQEPTQFGAKWRITDSARRYHRDVSMALALACFTAGEQSNSAVWFVRGEGFLGIGRGPAPQAPVAESAAMIQAREAKREADEQAKQDELERRDRDKMLGPGPWWTNWGG